MGTYQSNYTGLEIDESVQKTQNNLPALELKRKLEQNRVENALGEPTYNNEKLIKIEWKDSEDNTKRTDTFTYIEDATTETVTELRTLDTLQTLENVTIFDIDGNILSQTSNFNLTP